MLERVKKISEVLNLDARSINEIAKGATSRVWLLRAPASSYIVRIAMPNQGKHFQGFEADAGIRYELLKQDHRTPYPGATSGNYPDLFNDIDWSVDSFIAGEAPERGAIASRICSEIGEVLNALHQIPVKKQGRLMNKKTPLKGQFSTLEKGIQSRFQDPWPFTKKPLEKHPLQQIDSNLLAKLEPLATTIQEAAVSDSYSVVHADLHEKQFIIQCDHLQALIDFGDAMAAAPAWDIASFIYFHGVDLAKYLLEGYCQTRSEQQELFEKAKLLSITIALHHISRSFTLNRLSRRAFAHTHLKQLTSR